MPRTSFVVFGSAVCAVVSAGCQAVVGAVAPNRDATAIVFYGFRDTLLVGDSIGVYAGVNDKDGRPAWTDTVVVWQSSNTAVALLDESHPPMPRPHYFTWLRAQGSGQATITAHTQKVTSSKVITVVGANDLAVGDQRLGYALADQPTAAGPYSPSAATRFNSSGGDITVRRDSTGWYSVRFAGLSRKPGQRDNVQVTAYGAPSGTHCKLMTWSNGGDDLVVPVHCHLPGLDGPAVDARFTILVTGARAFDLSTPFAFGTRLPSTEFIQLDTSVTSFNSVTGHISFGRSAIGVYNFDFPGVGGAPRRAFLATSINPSPVRCRPQNYDLSLSRLQAGCYRGDGVANDNQVSVMWFTRGRVGRRYGYASAVNVAAASPANDTLFTASSSNGPITTRRIATGQWTVSFAGLGRPAGATDIVVLSAFVGADHSCSIISWGNSGTNDLAVTLQCFDPAGAPLDGRFSIIVVE